MKRIKKKVSQAVNKRFIRVGQDTINQQENIVVSPCEGTVYAVQPITENGIVISKNGKQLPLLDLVGLHAADFIGGTCITIYLSPRNKHYWRVPYSGTFIETHKNKGTRFIRAAMAIDKLVLRARYIKRAVKYNASIGSVLETKHGMIGMIAVGSLNVNRIHILYEENEPYKKGDICGYFTLGSSILLCFPNKNFEVLVKKKDKVKIGKPLVTIKQ